MKLGRNTEKYTNGKSFLLRTFLEKQQRRLADWLNRQFSSMSKHKQVLVLLIALLIMAGGSIYFLAQDGLGKIGNEKVIQPGLLPRQNNDLLNVEERLYQLEKFLDSLGQSEDGRKIKERILRHNPGLTDSVKKWKEQLMN